MIARVSLLLILAALALALFLFWMLTGKTNEAPAPTPSPPPQATSVTVPPAAARSTASRSGYRLAGTVVGDAMYAVIEQPDGTNDLYRMGQEVPGLGRLVDLGADRATFEASDGRIELQLAPASTPTVTPSPAEQPTALETTLPTEPSDRDLTPPAASPSGETDQSVS